VVLQEAVGVQDGVIINFFFLNHTEKITLHMITYLRRSQLNI
jgi:hypothetical protein